MTLILDPRYPLVWRTPDSLQLGVDNPPVLLDNVALGHERMLAALALGLTRAGLELIGTESGLTAHDIEEFRKAIQPALLTSHEAPRARVALAGVGPTVDRLCWRLTEAGLPPHHTGQRPITAAALHDPAMNSDTTDLAIVVGHYVLDPDFRSVWLRRDIPHLPIVYSDTSVTIGPMIEPGHGPCLYCLELHHRDADPAWPALAAQLLGAHSRAETPFLASEVATFATRRVIRRLQREASEPDGDAGASLTVDAVTGEQSRRVRGRHPDCGCAKLPDAIALDRPEIESVYSHQNVDRLRQPRKVAVVSVPA